MEMARFRNMSLPMMPALCVSVVSTCLFVTGVFAPGHWVMGSDTIGAYHLSPFSFCRGTDMSLCLPWDDHTHHEHTKLAPLKEEHVPGDVSCSEVMLSVGIIAFLVNNCLLLWCACVSPTQYWARNALECTISGFLHASGGTTLFLAIRMSSIEEDVSMGWGAYLVLVALACQLLTAQCTYLAIRSPTALRPDHSSTTICAVPITKSTASATEPGSVAQSRSASPAHQQDLAAEKLKKLKGISASEEKIPGSELLRMVHMYHQKNQDNLILRPVRLPLNSGSAEATKPTLDKLGLGAMAMSVDLCAWMTQLSSSNPSEEVIVAPRSGQHSTDQSTLTKQANSPSDPKLTMGEQSTDQSTVAKQADSPTDPKLTEVKSPSPALNQLQ